MDYPYKYIVKTESTAEYGSGYAEFAFCDFNDAKELYDECCSVGDKCLMYRILKFDNFDL